MKKMLKGSVRRFCRDEHGHIFIIALIILAIGSLTLAPLLNYMGTGLKAGQTYENKTMEFYAADSGIEDAIWHILNNGEFLAGVPGTTSNLISYYWDESSTETGLPPYPDTGYESLKYQLSHPINDCDVEVILTRIPGGVFVVTSTAIKDDSSTAIRTFIEPSYVVTTIPGSGPSGVFENAATALDGNVNIGGNVYISSTPDPGNANIHANGDVNFSGAAATVDGNVTATGEISPEDYPGISGDSQPGADAVSPPDVDIDQLIAEAEAEGDIYNNNVSFSGGPPGQTDTLGPTRINGNLTIGANRTVVLQGTVYVDGTISVGANSLVKGGYTIVATGDVDFTGTSELGLEDIPFVISTGGDITATGTSWVSAVMYAMDGDVTLKGNFTVKGSVIGNNVYSQGNPNIMYPVGLSDIFDPSEPGEEDEETTSISDIAVRSYIIS